MEKSFLFLKGETTRLITVNDTKLPKKRLMLIQRALLELMFFMDPDERWVPMKKRMIFTLGEDGSLLEVPFEVFVANKHRYRLAT